MAGRTGLRYVEKRETHGAAKRRCDIVLRGGRPRDDAPWHLSHFCPSPSGTTVPLSGVGECRKIEKRRSSGRTCHTGGIFSCKRSRVSALTCLDSDLDGDSLNGHTVGGDAGITAPRSWSHWGWPPARVVARLRKHVRSQREGLIWLLWYGPTLTKRVGLCGDAHG